MMQIREQLRPYVMEQYEAAAADGTPIMRPLFFDFHNDTASQTVNDQQMFGPDYLVAREKYQFIGPVPRMCSRTLMGLLPDPIPPP